VYLTAVCEYMSAELLELSGNSAQDRKRPIQTDNTTILERDIFLAIHNDKELHCMFPGAIRNSGSRTVSPSLEHCADILDTVHDNYDGEEEEDDDDDDDEEDDDDDDDDDDNDDDSDDVGGGGGGKTFHRLFTRKLRDLGEEHHIGGFSVAIDPSDGRHYFYDEDAGYIF